MFSAQAFADYPEAAAFYLGADRQGSGSRIVQRTDRVSTVCSDEINTALTNAASVKAIVIGNGNGGRLEPCGCTTQRILRDLAATLIVNNE